MKLFPIQLNQTPAAASIPRILQILRSAEVGADDAERTQMLSRVGEVILTLDEGGIETVLPALIAAGLDVAVAVHAEMEVVSLRQDLLPYSDGQIWDEDRVVSEIHHHTETIVHSAYTIGKRLIWAREHLGTGRFADFCRRRLPQYSTATLYRYMQVAELLVAHPKLLQPAAAAGMKKTLLLTTLAPDQVDRVLEDGLIAQAPIEQLDTVSYAELKAEVDKLKKGKAAAEDKLAKAEGERDKAKLALAGTDGRILDDEKELLKLLTRARDQFDDTLRAVRLTLAPIHARFAVEGHLSPELRAHVAGLLEYMSTMAHSDKLQGLERIGEGTYSQELLELMEVERPLASTYSMPRDLVAPQLQGRTPAGDTPRPALRSIT